jgi:hypothetical protein
MVLSEEEGAHMRKLNLTLLAVFLFTTVYCFAETMIASADIPFNG